VQRCRLGRNFDGTTWTTPSITGVTSATLINVASYKTRLWFVQKDTTKAWYLGTSSISGAATSLEMGDKFREGGKLLHIGSLSRDSGAGRWRCHLLHLVQGRDRGLYGLRPVRHQQLDC
jgi:hypothetical protein